MSLMERVFLTESDHEFEKSIKLAVERYKNNQNPERKNDSKKNEVFHGKKKEPKKPKERCELLTEIFDKSGKKMRGCLKDYENQGAIPKGIFDGIKSKGWEEKYRRGRKNSRSPNARSSSRDSKSVTRKKNSDYNKNVPNGNTSDIKAKFSEKFLKSFYYIVPEEPSPDFFLSPGTYYVVSKPIDLSTEAILVCHPQRSEKHLQKNDYKGGKRHRQAVEHFVISPTNLNDLNKSERNCSNVNLVKDLISEYNSENSKIEISSKLKTLKPDLEAEIEALKLALTESTIALEQLTVLELSLNCTVSQDKEFRNKEINIKEDFKGTESREKNGDENCFVNEGNGGGELDVTPVENSSENNELTIAPEERTKAKEEEENPLPSDIQDQDIPVDEFSEERLREETINSRILHIVSVLPDISVNYLQTELQKIGDNFDSINIFINDLLEQQNYPKSNVDPDETERKALWKEYVTNFNPKKFLFELSKGIKGATASNIDSDENDYLDVEFLKTRYPTLPVETLTQEYESSKNLEAICKRYDETLNPVRLSESEFWSEKFNKEFLLKVTYLDHKQEIDDFLSAIQKRRELEREEAKLLNSFLECSICFGEMVASETTTCSDGHIFCSNCVEEYIRVELGKGIYKFKCLSGDCDAFFGHKTLEELLPASTLSKISMKQQVEEIMEAKVDGLESCSFCYFAYVPDPDDKIFKCQNAACMAEICRKCHERNHIPLRCDEIERPKDVEARKEVEEVMTNILVRTCPSCKKKIVRIDGCNKISCTCGTLFCYLCQQKIDGYSHFGSKCRLHSGNTELHVENVERAGIRARDELLRKDPGIRFVHDPTKGF